MDGGDERADARQGIQSVELAMTVLRALEAGRGPMSLTQIAAACDMGASKVHRYLVSLARGGLVTQSRSSGHYDFGPALRRMGIEAMRRTDEVGLASAHLPGLRDRTGHSVNLAVWGEHGPVIVRWEYGAYALPITVRVGANLPLLSSSVGRVYLAHLPDVLTRPLLDVERAADVDVSDRELAAITAAVRRDGVAITSGGVIPGVASLAVPVFVAGQSLPLVVAVAMPAREAEPDVLASVSDALREVAAAMTAELGGAEQAARQA